MKHEFDLFEEDSFADLVEEFHIVFEVPVADKPSIPPADIKALRKKLIKEEYEELMKAIEDDDLLNIADGIADLHYVVSGTSLAYGIPEAKVFAEVHRSNMSKANPDGSVNRRPDGKILKSIHYTPANIRAVLDEAMR